MRNRFLENKYHFIAIFNDKFCFKRYAKYFLYFGKHLHHAVHSPCMKVNTKICIFKFPRDFIFKTC